MVYIEVTELKVHSFMRESPVADLKIKDGNKVRVKGIKRKDKVTAKSIMNLTTNSAECECTTAGNYRKI